MTLECRVGLNIEMRSSGTEMASFKFFFDETANLAYFSNKK